MGAATTACSRSELRRSRLRRFASYLGLKPSDAVELRHLDHQPGSRHDRVDQLESVGSNPPSPTSVLSRDIGYT